MLEVIRGPGTLPTAAIRGARTKGSLSCISSCRFACQLSLQRSHVSFEFANLRVKKRILRPHGFFGFACALHFIGAADQITLNDVEEGVHLVHVVTRTHAGGAEHGVAHVFW